MVVGLTVRSIISTSDFFFNSKELTVLLQFVDLTCFSYFVICVNFALSNCRLETSNFHGQVVNFV